MPLLTMAVSTAKQIHCLGYNLSLLERDCVIVNDGFPTHHL